MKTILMLFAVFFFRTALADDMSARFALEVGGVKLDTEYAIRLEAKVKGWISRLDSPQYVLVVDRNHSVQIAVLGFVDPSNGKLSFLGADRVSTGSPARSGHFETPEGVFPNIPANPSYRALGTKNSKGWRGLGAKGSRVWDLGWQETVHKGKPYTIRLLLHSTDPDFGEVRLGKVDSKGCIRISARFNKFLDRYGILDSEFENHPKGKAVLLKDRTPVSGAGRNIIVVET